MVATVLQAFTSSLGAAPFLVKVCADYLGLGLCGMCEVMLHM